VLWALVDAVAAWCLVQIWRLRQNRPDSVRDGLVLSASVLGLFVCVGLRVLQILAKSLPFPTLYGSLDFFSRERHLARRHTCSGQTYVSAFGFKVSLNSLQVGLRFHYYSSLSCFIYQYPR